MFASWRSYHASGVPPYINQRVHRCGRPELGLFKPLYSVFQCLPLIAEPNAHHLTIIVQFLCDFCHLLTGGVSILLEVDVEDFQGLRRERGPAFALLEGSVPINSVRFCIPERWRASASAIQRSSTGLIFWALFGVMSNFSNLAGYKRPGFSCLSDC